MGMMDMLRMFTRGKAPKAADMSHQEGHTDTEISRMMERMESCVAVKYSTYWYGPACYDLDDCS